MKVVHVITDLGQGGAEAMLEKLLHAGRSVAPEVRQEVLSLRTPGVVGPRLQAAGFAVHALGMGGGVAASLRAFARLVRALRAQPREAIVQTWLYHGDLLGGLAARLAGRRHVAWNLRGGFIREGLSTPTHAVARLCALLSRRVPEMIVSCGEQVRDSHAAIGYATDRAVVVDNGFDTTRFAPDAAAGDAVRAELGLPADAPVVGVIARLHPLKDYPNFAEAARLVLATRPDTRFLWVGKDVDTDEALGRQVQALGLAGSVRRIGLRSDVPRLLNALDVFCLPSRAEGFPNALGEAMACGLHCVSTDVGDAARILGDPRWMVPPRDPRALADALLRSLALPADERRRSGGRNRRRIVDEYSIEASARRYLSLYDQLVAGTFRAAPDTP